MTTESSSELAAEPAMHQADAAAEMPQAETESAQQSDVETVLPLTAAFESAVEIALEMQQTAKKTSVVMDESLGLRLRAAREAKGLTCETAAQQLRLPVSVVQALEAERFERIGHAIYLRSYLTKYLQLLDLPQVLAERALHEHAAPPPPLVTTGTVSRPRYLFDRYSGSALYLILTGVIVVPAVLLAMRAGFDQNLVRVTPLDSAEIAVPAPKPLDEAAAPAKAASEPAASVPSAAEKTPTPAIIASMAPFPASTASESVKAEPTAASGRHTLRLSLGESSWVEITAADGQKLEYGLLPAGSSRSYAADKALDVRIGNANGATLEVDGKAQDIAPYRHSNVAHFRIADGATSTAPHSGG
jgi:cytoskeleton protein RodZ